MAITYILYSKKTRKLYTGSTHEDSTSTRLTIHNAGRVRSTKHGKPWEIVHTENYPSYKDARKRELFLKTGIGRKWIKSTVQIPRA